MMMRALTSLALLGALLIPAGGALADTVDERPKLAIAIGGAPSAFTKNLANRVAAMRRFTIVDGPSARGRLGGIPLTPAITVAQTKRAQTASGADLLLDGKYQNTGGQVKITGRLFDFRNGEVSRELVLLGDGRTADSLGTQLAAFVRYSMPLKCYVKEVAEDTLVLDLGATDGMTLNALFRVYRHPLNMKPVDLGTVRVTQVEPFAARAEVEDAPRGTTYLPGDMLVEQTASLLFPAP